MANNEDDDGSREDTIDTTVGEAVEAASAQIEGGRTADSEEAAQSDAQDSKAQPADREKSKNINNDSKFNKRLHELAQRPSGQSQIGPPAGEAAPKTYDNKNILQNFASLPPHPTVHDVVKHISYEYGVEFNDRQVLQVAKQRNAVVRINGVVRIRMSLMYQALSGLLDSIADKYTKSSHAKRVSQYRSAIVRKALIKSATESILVEESDENKRSASDLRETQLASLFTDVNAEIILKNNSLNTVVEGYSRGLIAEFRNTDELSSFIANLMLNTLRADRKK